MGIDVKKDVKQQKQEAESQSMHADYFTKRDKQNRGTSGLVNDATNILTAEGEVKEMLFQASLKEIKLPEGTEPMFNTMFLTAKRNKLTNEAGLYLPTASFGTDGSTDLEQDFSAIQKVMSTGPQCQQVKPGMLVKVNVDNFKRKADESLRSEIQKDFIYEMPIVTINNIDYIRISERDVDYIVDNRVDGYRR